VERHAIPATHKFIERIRYRSIYLAVGQKTALTLEPVDQCGRSITIQGARTIVCQGESELRTIAWGFCKENPEVET
jgi:hypothetical protein